ncbi:hypothetical protein Y032_0130g1554 [Ancylostoma ceylanicum]|uniref:Uncharacterized protein n=1 Tax=Ancylostoma ceylanicum TaxID=53326 RepID=A0A016T7F4_9BILA|nr:hypothetical protein Y032_0130g1554 [Ancylostoma ceylanicum]
MGDAKAAGIPLLDFERSNEVAHKSSTQVTPKSKCGCFQSLSPHHSNSYCSSTTSIAVEDANLDIENLRSITQQHARDGNVEALEALLDKHALLVNKPDMEGLTALHYAAKYGNVEVAELLLNRGALLESYTYKDCYAPFHMVAKYGRVGTQQHSNRESVVSFIDASAHRTQSLPGTERTPNASDPTTALVVLFVKRGGDVNIKDRYQMTPLDHATLKDNERIVRALLKNGANPNEMDENESTPLLKACVCGSYNLVRLLLSSGADCNIADKWHNSVYHMAARHGRNDVLQLLIDHAGKNAVELLWTMNSEGKTPLELAVNGNHASTVNIILSMKPPGSDSAMFQMDKWLLHKAAERGFLEVVKILIQNGYNVRLRDDDKKLPLHAAAMSKRLDVVRYLLELAPDCIDEKDGYGLSAFLYAVSMDALETVKMLVESNTDILATDFDGRTAVYIGAKYNAINVLMYLLEIYRAQKAEEGASYPDMVDQEDYNQDTPMHLVCHNGYMEAVTLLHEYGARLDILDEDERISLHRAASEGQTAVVRQLVEWDKRLMVHKDEHGNTPLHLAAENGGNSCYG